MNSLKPKTGFTLTEVVVYIGLFSLVLVFLVQFLAGILKAHVQDAAREEVEASLVQAVNVIDNEVRHGILIYTPTSTFSSSPGELSLETVRALPAGEITTYVDFFVSNDERLCMRRDTGVGECLTSPRLRVTNLQFIRITPSSGTEAVQTKLTLEYRSAKVELQSSASLQSTAKLRPYVKS